MITVDLCKSFFCAGKALAFSLSPVHMYVYGLENLKTGGMTSSPDKFLGASLTIFLAWIGSSASETSGACSSFLLGFRSFLSDSDVEFVMALFLKNTNACGYHLDSSVDALILLVIYSSERLFSLIL